MEKEKERAPAKVAQFRDISEADARLVNRVVQDRHDTNKGEIKHFDMQTLGNLFRRTLRDTTDVRNIFVTQPDLNLPREILVSAICSPGDLSTTSLIFGNKLPGIDTNLTSQLIGVLENFFIDQQGLENIVPEWVDEALIIGAHPMLIIPEASVDRMINGGVDTASMESVASYGGEWQNDWFKPKGIFGLGVPGVSKTEYVSLESSRHRLDTTKLGEYHTIKLASPVKAKQLSLPIKVTDNMAALRMPAVQAAKRSSVLEKAYGSPAMESRRSRRMAQEAQIDADAEKDAKNNDNALDNRPAKGKKKDKRTPSNSEIYSKYFKAPQGVKKSRLVVVPTLKQAGGETVGHPLVYHLPIEAVMPVCVPGDETNHVGYIVALDGSGFPLSMSRKNDYYSDIRRGAMGGDQAGSSSQVAGELLNMTSQSIKGGIPSANNEQIDRLAKFYGEMMDADLVSRFKTGLMGGDFEISHPEDFDLLMLARTFKNQLTTLLYVPAELMVYMAYDYNEYGIGKSLLEDAKALCAMRAAITMANAIGQARNAIPGKDINIELDPDDGTPIETVAFLTAEAMALSHRQFPLGVTSPMMLAEQLQMSAFSVNVSGNPRYPETKTTITPRESQMVPIDTEFQQQLRDDIVRVFSLTPEMVDGANQPEFATTGVRNSLMLLKRVMVIQRKTNPQISDYVRIYSRNSGPLVDELMEIIEANKKDIPKEYEGDVDDFFADFMNALEVKLPAPDTENLPKQIELYTAYSDALDKVIPAFIREEYFDGFADQEIKDALPTVIEAIKGRELRRYMRERGLFRELDIFTNDEDGSPMVNMEEEMTQHVEGLINCIAGYAKMSAEDAKDRKKKTEALKKLLDKVREEVQAVADDGGIGGTTVGEDTLAEGANDTSTDPGTDDPMALDLGTDDDAATTDDNATSETETSTTEDTATTDDATATTDESTTDTEEDPDAPGGADNKDGFGLDI